jgi:hypothetical protein
MIFYATSVILAFVSLITANLGALVGGLVFAGLGIISEKWT